MSESPYRRLHPLCQLWVSGIIALWYVLKYIIPGLVDLSMVKWRSDTVVPLEISVWAAKQTLQTPWHAHELVPLSIEMYELAAKNAAALHGNPPTP